MLMSFQVREMLEARIVKLRRALGDVQEIAEEDEALKDIEERCRAAFKEDGEAAKAMREAEERRP